MIQPSELKKLTEAVMGKKLDERSTPTFANKDWSILFGEDYHDLVDGTPPDETCVELGVYQLKPSVSKIKSKQYICLMYKDAGDVLLPTVSQVLAHLSSIVEGEIPEEEKQEIKDVLKNHAILESKRSGPKKIVKESTKDKAPSHAQMSKEINLKKIGHKEYSFYTDIIEGGILYDGGEWITDMFEIGGKDGEGHIDSTQSSTFAEAVEEAYGLHLHIKEKMTKGDKYWLGKKKIVKEDANLDDEIHNIKNWYHGVSVKVNKFDDIAADAANSAFEAMNKSTNDIYDVQKLANDIIETLEEVKESYKDTVTAARNFVESDEDEDGTSELFTDFNVMISLLNDNLTYIKSNWPSTPEVQKLLKFRFTPANIKIKD